VIIRGAGLITGTSAPCPILQIHPLIFLLLLLLHHLLQHCSQHCSIIVTCFGLVSLCFGLVSFTHLLLYQTTTLLFCQQYLLTHTQLPHLPASSPLVRSHSFNTFFCLNLLFSASSCTAIAPRPRLIPLPTSNHAVPLACLPTVSRYQSTNTMSGSLFQF